MDFSQCVYLSEIRFRLFSCPIIWVAVFFKLAEIVSVFITCTLWPSGLVCMFWFKSFVPRLPEKENFMVHGTGIGIWNGIPPPPNKLTDEDLGMMGVVRFGVSGL